MDHDPRAGQEGPRPEAAGRTQDGCVRQVPQGSACACLPQPPDRQDRRRSKFWHGHQALLRGLRTQVSRPEGCRSPAAHEQAGEEPDALGEEGPAVGHFGI